MPLQRIVIFIFCICISSKALSQITETTTAVDICFPDNITYQGPVGATNFTWTFGPYAPSYTLSNSFAPTSTGTFNAIFNGILSGSPYSFTVLVKVHPRPTANFSISQPLNACAVKNVTLTDQSTGSSPMVSWTWVYGDGGINSFTTGAPHSYGYNSVGNWSVTLVVKDQNGCDAQLTKGTINVIPSPTAVISSHPASLVGCANTFTAVFSGSNSIGSGLTYNWNFGNGQNSTQATSGVQTYTQQTNMYPVTLTVTSNNCSNSTTVYVTVSPATLSVTIPSTVCMGVSPVATVQSNQPYSVWNISSGGLFSVLTPAPGNPTVGLPPLGTAGIHTITINAGTSPCVATPITRTVFVEQVVPSFTGSTPTVSCASPFIVSYSNTSSPPGSTAQWSYKDADSVLHTGTGNNPTFSLTLGSLNQYALFYRPFTPTVNMVVTSAAGCTAAISRTVHSLAKPTAWFYQSASEGCAPQVVTFTNNSWVYPSGPIISYTWNNGAPGSASLQITGNLNLPPSSNSIVPNQTFTYSTPGVYHPSLTIQTANNYTDVTNTCIDVSWQGTVTVVTPPQISFNVPPGPFCPTDVVQISNTSPDISKVQNWHVTSDNGFFSHCNTETDPGWKFTNVGSHNFTLTGYHHSCPGFATAGPVVVTGPIVEARYETYCAKNLRTTVQFSVELQEVSQATLNFGDGNTQVFLGNTGSGQVVNTTTTHVYNSTGDYLVTLTGENPLSGCVNDTYTMMVRVRDVAANIVAQPTACINQPAQFIAGSSQDVLTGCSRGYIWYVDNLPPIEKATDTLLFSFGTAGNHSVKMFVKDINSCVDSTDFSIRVSEVHVGFALSSSSVCLSNATVNITNSSLQTPDPLIGYTWDFGVGNLFQTTQLTVPTQTYFFANSPQSIYTVVLTATNSLGCTASTSKTLSVKLPAFNFNASSYDFCVSMAAPTTITFTPNLPYTSYTINFGASASSTAIATGPSSFPYTAPGSYSAVIRVKDVQGCENTGTVNVNGVQTPTANFDFSSPNSTGGNSLCSGKIVTFTNVSQPMPHTPQWQFGNQFLGTTANTVSGSFSAPVTSVVAIGMTVNTGPPAFCPSSITKTFTIYNYKGNFKLSDSLVCLGSAISFSITDDSHGLGAILWSFGDATSSPTLFPPSDPTFTSHIYSVYPESTNGYVNMALLFWSGDMACRDLIDTTIKVIRLLPDFDRNLELTSIDTAHCIEVEDKFHNLTTSNSSQLTYTWSFGDGTQSNDTDPTHMYTTDGTFPVKLEVRDKQNCRENITRNMIIYPLPTATILPAAGGYCPDVNHPLEMMGSPGVVSGTWSPASAIAGSPEFTTATGSHTATAFSGETSSYSLSVTNQYGCVSKGTDTTVRIIQPPQQMQWDTSVVIGEPVPLPDLVPDLVTFTWTPLTADLNCLTCANPVSSTTVDIVYTLVMEDLAKCSEVNNTYSIHILPRSSVDVPTAFTPNGDGKNDVIYAAGWGIRSLHYFRIYNRWGQLLFETTDINEGWDGTYNGVPQNTETYVYQVSVETYIDNEPLIKSSTFKLIR